MKMIKMLTIAAFTLASSAALAGFTQPALVTVDLDAGFASGDMISARDAADTVTFIGCGVRRFDDGLGTTWSWGFCQASDADGNSITCFTETESLLETMRATADSSFITFSWVEPIPDQAECTRVGFSTQSFYLRKK